MKNLNEIQKALNLLSLTPNAIKFYLASYKHGLASVGTISKLIKIDRSSGLPSTRATRGYWTD